MDELHFAEVDRLWTAERLPHSGTGDGGVSVRVHPTFLYGAHPLAAVNGSFNGTQRSADTVLQKDAVEGLVQSVAADGLSLIVMGQTVLVDNSTLIDDDIPARNVLNLVAGTDHVEINGHIRPNGRASRHTASAWGSN